MRTIIGLGLMLITCYTQAAHYWVFGDSLTSPPDSWARQIERAGLATFNNMAQPGHMMTRNDIPSYLNCNKSEVIIWLGTNDMGSGVPTKRYSKKLTKTLDKLSAVSCKVWLVLPVYIDWNSEFSTRSISYRQATLSVSARYSNVTTLDSPYNSAETTDGLHPNTADQLWRAIWFAEQLGLL